MEAHKSQPTIHPLIEGTASATWAPVRRRMSGEAFQHYFDAEAIWAWSVELEVSV